MIAPEIDAQLSSEIVRIKRMTIQRNARGKWVLGASLIAGVVAAVAVWFMQKPIDRDEIMLWRIN